MYLKRHLDGGNYFAVENIQVIAEDKLINRCAIGANVFYITITYLRSLAFKVGELNQDNQDRCRWNEMILRVHETTLTTKC